MIFKLSIINEQASFYKIMRGFESTVMKYAILSNNSVFLHDSKQAKR